MTGAVPDLSEGRRQISEAVIGGAALSKFQAMMEAQGVATAVAAQLCSTHTDYFKVLRKSQHQLELPSEADGNVYFTDACFLPKAILEVLDPTTYEQWLLTFDLLQFQELEKKLIS